MKKLLFGLSAILLCFMMASCGGSSTSKDNEKKNSKKESPIDRLQSLTEDIEKNGNEWTDEEKWDEAQVKAAEIVIAFAESDPSEDEFKEFEDALEDLNKAISHINDEEAKKAMDKAGDKFEKNHKDLNRDLEKAQKKLRKIVEKYAGADDDDDDYSDDDADYDATAAEAPASSDAPLF